MSSKRSIPPRNNQANIKNANKGSSGTNRQYDQNQGNRGKQLNPNQKRITVAISPYRMPSSLYECSNVTISDWNTFKRERPSLRFSTNSECERLPIHALLDKLFATMHCSISCKSLASAKQSALKHIRKRLALHFNNCDHYSCYFWLGNDIFLDSNHRFYCAFTSDIGCESDYGYRFDLDP